MAVLRDWRCSGCGLVVEGRVVEELPAHVCVVVGGVWVALLGCPAVGRVSGAGGSPGRGSG